MGCLLTGRGGSECRREGARGRPAAATYPGARAASGVGEDRTGGARRCGPQRGRNARCHSALQPARDRLLFCFQRYDAALVSRAAVGVGCGSRIEPYGLTICVNVALEPLLAASPL